MRRRDCLLALAALPWLPRLALASTPRVVALSWESAEHLLMLDVEPLGVADAGDYRSWVVRPTLPPVVPSVGSRTEPNLELLAQLRPELITLPPLLADLRPRLERIAPLLQHRAFAEQGDNYLSQRKDYLQLARRLQREALGEARLAQLDLRIAALRERIQRHFAGRPPKVTVVRFSSPSVVFVNTANSMVQRALDLLGLQPAQALAASPWGIVQWPVTALGQLDDGVVLHIEPFAQQQQLFSTRLWQAMPFVRAGHFGAMRSTWTYGGAFSVEYLAEAISDALLRLA